MAKSIVYFQSGGPTAVINSSFYGVIERGRELGLKVFGSRYGVEGLINDDLIDVTAFSLDWIRHLKQTPGAVLGSSRKKVGGDTEAIAAIRKTVEKYDIGVILVNGGNDSMNTALTLSKELKDVGVKVIGVPKTVDNDLACCDHTPGFGSAAKYVVNTIAEMAIDASSYRKGKVTIVEIMGRDAGWITASTVLLPEEVRPDLILVPERPFSKERFLQEVKDVYAKKHYALLAVSEGIRIPREYVGNTDAFGNANLEGAVFFLEKMVRDELGIGVRSTMLSTPSRACPAFVSKTDQEEAILVGRAALDAALNGETGKMVTIVRDSDKPYAIHTELAKLESIASVCRFIPNAWVIDDRTFSQELIDYIAPLIKGEIEVEYDENGLMAFSRI